MSDRLLAAAKTAAGLHKLGFSTVEIHSLSFENEKHNAYAYAALPVSDMTNEMLLRLVDWCTETQRSFYISNGKFLVWGENSSD